MPLDFPHLVSRPNLGNPQEDLDPISSLHRSGRPRTYDSAVPISLPTQLRPSMPLSVSGLFENRPDPSQLRHELTALARDPHSGLSDEERTSAWLAILNLVERPSDFEEARLALFGLLQRREPSPAQTSEFLASYAQILSQRLHAVPDPVFQRALRNRASELAGYWQAWNSDLPGSTPAERSLRLSSQVRLSVFLSQAEVSVPDLENRTSFQDLQEFIQSIPSQGGERSEAFVQALQFFASQGHPEWVNVLHACLLQAVEALSGDSLLSFRIQVAGIYREARSVFEARQDLPSARALGDYAAGLWREVEAEAREAGGREERAFLNGPETVSAEDIIVRYARAMSGVESGNRELGLELLQNLALAQGTMAGQSLRAQLAQRMREGAQELSSSLRPQVSAERIERSRTITLAFLDSFVASQTPRRNELLPSARELLGLAGNLRFLLREDLPHYIQGLPAERRPESFQEALRGFASQSPEHQQRVSELTRVLNHIGGETPGSNGERASAHGPVWSLLSAINHLGEESDVREGFQAIERLLTQDVSYFGRSDQAGVIRGVTDLLMERTQDRSLRDRMRSFVARIPGEEETGGFLRQVFSMETAISLVSMYVTGGLAGIAQTGAQGFTRTLLSRFLMRGVSAQAARQVLELGFVTSEALEGLGSATLNANTLLGIRAASNLAGTVTNAYVFNRLNGGQDFSRTLADISMFQALHPLRGLFGASLLGSAGYSLLSSTAVSPMGAALRGQTPEFLEFLHMTMMGLGTESGVAMARVLGRTNIGRQVLEGLRQEWRQASERARRLGNGLMDRGAAELYRLFPQPLGLMMGVGGGGGGRGPRDPRSDPSSAHGSPHLERALGIEEQLGDENTVVRSDANLPPLSPELQRIHRDLRDLATSNRAIQDFARLSEADRRTLTLHIEKDLNNAIADVRIDAVLALRDIIPHLEPSERLPRVLRIEERLADENVYVRIHTALVLREMIPHLEPSERLALALRIEARLGDTDAEVRSSAVSALGEITPHLGASERLPWALRIEARLWDEDADVRSSAADAVFAIFSVLDTTDQATLLVRLQERNAEDCFSRCLSQFSDRFLLMAELEAKMNPDLPHYNPDPHFQQSVRSLMERLVPGSISERRQGGLPNGSLAVILSMGAAGLATFLGSDPAQAATHAMTQGSGDFWSTALGIGASSVVLGGVFRKMSDWIRGIRRVNDESPPEILSETPSPITLSEAIRLLGQGTMNSEQVESLLRYFRSIFQEGSRLRSRGGYHADFGLLLDALGQMASQQGLYRIENNPLSPFFQEVSQRLQSNDTEVRMPAEYFLSDMMASGNYELWRWIPGEFVEFLSSRIHPILMESDTEARRLYWGQSQRYYRILGKLEYHSEFTSQVQMRFLDGALQYSGLNDLDRTDIFFEMYDMALSDPSLLPEFHERINAWELRHVERGERNYGHSTSLPALLVSWILESVQASQGHSPRPVKADLAFLEGFTSARGRHCRLNCIEGSPFNRLYAHLIRRLTPAERLARINRLDWPLRSEPQLIEQIRQEAEADLAEANSPTPDLPRRGR